MLAKPSVKQMMGKVGSRYEVALTVAKRARRIAAKRLEDGDPDISDPVDVAAKEIDEGKVKIIKEEVNVVKTDDIIDDSIIE